jgi:hypothetical protein
VSLVLASSKWNNGSDKELEEENWGSAEEAPVIILYYLVDYNFNGVLRPSKA